MSNVDLENLFDATPTLEEFKSELMRLKNDYSDEIPKVVVDSSTPLRPDGKGYKVRHAWFQQLSYKLSLAEMDGFIPEDLIDRARDFSHFISTDKFKERLTSKEDIDMANSLIDDILSQIE